MSLLSNDRSRFFQLLARKKSGEILLEEQRELIALCSENPSFAALADEIDKLFKSELIVEAAPEECEVEQKWNDFESRIVKDRPILVSGHSGRNILLRGLAAAAVIAAIIAGFFVFNTKEHPLEIKESPNIVSTKKGSKSNLVLPDGTKVWLNADSRISYTGDFNTKREVSLSGEAFFDVVHNKIHPFIVHTKVMDIKVVGTAFNVRAYDSEANTQTTLLRGAVEVSLIKKNGEKITLKPNEKLVVLNDYEMNDKIIRDEAPVPKISLTSVKSNIADSVTNEVLWVQNKLVFDQMKLKDISDELERWYNVKVIVKDSSLANRSLSGIYENESLTEVLESFKLAAGINYTVKNNIVEIFK